MFSDVTKINNTFNYIHGIVSVYRLMSAGLLNIRIVYITLGVESNYIHVLLIDNCLYMDVPIGPVRVGLCECLGCPTYCRLKVLVHP